MGRSARGHQRGHSADVALLNFGGRGLHATELPCRFRLYALLSLHPVIRDEIYRIGREALVNAFRHSRASRIEVELEYGARRFRLIVRDNGRGIDPHVLHAGRDGHWGLPGMRERAEKFGARLRVWSRTSAGTEIELSVSNRIAIINAVIGK